MPVIINGTTGINNSNGGYTGDGISFADGTPANTLVTDTSGNVGIGTSSPAEKLDVVGGVIRHQQQNDSVTGNHAVLFTNSNSTLDYGFTIEHINNGVIDAGITVGGGGVGPVGFITFKTNTAGNVATERMRITSIGELLMGATSVGLSNTNSFTLSPAGASAIANHSNTAGGWPYWTFGYNGSGIGSITQNGTTAVAYNTSSDYRLKEQITPMTGALAKNELLNPVTYKWKVDGSDGQGFIAHELQAVFPDAVTGDKDAVDDEGKPVYQGVDTSFLVGHLVACVKELKAELDSVKAELATLKGAA